MRDYIEINKELIPYSFDILLAEEWYELAIDYNKTGDLFTLSLYRDGALVTSEPLILDRPLFGDTYQPGPFPAVEIVPMDPNGLAAGITWDNFGESVFLTIDDETGDDDEGI